MVPTDLKYRARFIRARHVVQARRRKAIKWLNLMGPADILTLGDRS